MEGKTNKNKDDIKTGDEKGEANDYILEPEVDEEDLNKDRPNTIKRKEQFLKLFPRCRFIVSLTCKQMTMATKTYYTWLRDDEEFAKAIDKAVLDTNKIVRDILMHKVVVEKETRAITYYLDRKDPEFKPTSKTEVVTGSRTLEDILAEDKEKINEPTNNGEAGDNNQERGEGAGPEVPAGEAVQDQGQTGEAPAVPPKQDPAVLLEEKDTPQHHSKSAPEGHKQGNRRGPALRLRT